MASTKKKPEKKGGSAPEQGSNTRRVSLGQLQAEQTAPEERLVVVRPDTGEATAQTLPEALRSQAEGTGRIARRDEIDSLIRNFEVEESRRAQHGALDHGSELKDSAWAYGVNAWDEFTFGASTALMRGAARVRGEEAEFLQWVRRLREDNPVAYHLGGFAGGIGQLVATEGTLSALKAQKLLQAEKLAARAAELAKAGKTAEAAEVAAEAREAVSAASGADAAAGLKGEEAAQRAGSAEAYGLDLEAGAANDNAIGLELPANDNAIGLGLPANDNGAFNRLNPNAMGGRPHGSLFELGPEMPRNRVPALFQQPGIRQEVSEAASLLSDADAARMAELEPESLRSVKAGERLAYDDAYAAEEIVEKIEQRAAEATPTGIPEPARSTRVAPLLEGLSKSVAQGALTGVGYDVSSSAMGDKPFSVEDMMASGLAGAAIGGASHVGTTLASRGLAKAAGAFAEREANRAVAQVIREAGLTDPQFKRLVMDFAGAADGKALGMSEVESAVNNLRKTIEQGGVDLVKMKKPELYKAIAKGKAEVGEARQKLFEYANSKGVGAHVKEARMMRNLAELINSAETSSTTGAHKKATDLFGRFEEDMLKLGEMDVEKKLARMDKLQGEMGQAERDALKLTGEQTIDSKLFASVRNIIRDEMSQAFENTGNKDLIAAYKANNKVYAAFSMMDRYLSAKSMGADLNKFAGLIPVDTSGPGRILGRAAVSTAFFGKPHSLFYDAAGGSLLRGIGRGVNALRRGVAGLASSVAAREGAQRAFPRALQGLVKGTTKAAFSTLSPELEAIKTKGDFDAMIRRVEAGLVTQDVREQFEEVSPNYSPDIDAWNDKLLKNVTAMLPPQSPYAIGPWVGSVASQVASKQLAITSEQIKVLRYLDGVSDPLGVPGKVVNGTAGPEHVKAVKDMYPGLFTEMVDGLMSSIISGAFDDVLQTDPEVRMALSNFIGQPLSAVDSMKFATAVTIARQMAEEKMAQRGRKKKKKGGGGGGGGGGTSPPNAHNTQTESERISS